MWLKDLQPFYQNIRHYTIFKDRPYECVVKVNPAENKPIKDYYTSKLDNVIEQCKTEKKKPSEKQLKAIFKKAVVEKEKKIRYYCTEDRILLKMIRHVFQKMNTKKEKLASDSGISKFPISLNDIYPNSAKNPLEEEEDMEAVLNGRTIVAHRKRKDYSFFMRFLYDERMENILPYFSEAKIDFDRLVAEMEDYEQCREVVFCKVFELEKSILSVISPEDKTTLFDEGTKKDCPNVQHFAYLNWLKEKNYINQGDWDLLFEIRNKFCHNEFPKKDKISKIPSFDLSHGHFTLQIASWYEKKVNEIQKQLCHQV